MIGLRRARCDHSVATLRERLGEEKFELTRLVTAERQPCEIIAFYPEMRAAEMTRKALHLPERSREKPEGTSL